MQRLIPFKSIPNDGMLYNLNVKFRLCISVLLLYTSFVIAQNESNFLHLEETFYGNSQIIEDSLGYIWISNSDGLYKYDGYDFSFVPYQNIFKGKYSSNQKFLLQKDNNENIWIAVYGGKLTKLNSQYTEESLLIELNNAPKHTTAITPHEKDVWFGSKEGSIYRYDEKNTTIRSLFTLPKNNGFAQTILSIAFTSTYEMWISTDHGKVYQHIINTDILKELKSPLTHKKQDIKLTSDLSGKLWIATELEGLYSYYPNFGEFTQFNPPEKNGSHDLFLYVYAGKNNNIWAGTDGNGLYKINSETNAVTIFKHEEINKFSISNNTVTFINEDSYGNIWTVAKKGQINILPNNANKIKYYNGLENNTPTSVLSILKSEDGSTWIGTDGKGLNRVFTNGTKIQYDSSKKGNNFFKGRYIQGLIEDKDKNIWIATYLNGLWKFDTSTKRFTEIKTQSTTGIYSPDVRHLFKDTKDRIWVSTAAGVHVFSSPTELLATFDYNTNGFLGTVSQAINEDENGTVWLGVNNGGLFEFVENQSNFAMSSFKSHSYYSKEEIKHNNYDIAVIKPDYNGNLWLLSDSGFLIRYTISSKTAESFLTNQNLENIDISAILIMDPNNLWISSKNGIHNYILDTGDLKSFYTTDGLQGNTFLKRSAYKDRTGKLYFGGEDGMNTFYTEDMHTKEPNAKIYINAIEVLNKPVQQILQNKITLPIENLTKLDLASKHSSFSFQFSAIDNVLNSNYHYAYRLKGFDKNWITTKKNRIATYTNIPSGSYVFEVKAGSKRGEWNIEATQIKVNIKPTFWGSIWAYILYIILSCLIIIGISYWLSLKKEIRKKAWQNEKDKELYALKMNFFAKMSHEIQTPLTLILGPIDDMLHRAVTNNNELLKQRLFILKNNAKRLSRIATELMTIRNKELGTLKVLASRNNLTEHLKEIALSFSEQARFKNIHFIKEYSTKEDLFIWYDSDKIEHVLYNLLSNAFKFTPRNGTITLKTHLVKDTLEISVEDSGPGIPKNELEDIFKLFYQSELGKHQKGLGIGLALTKELISLHHGEIKVTSSAEKGTCFTVAISAADNVFSEDEKISPEAIFESTSKLYTDIENYEVDLLPAMPESKEKTHTLLIVEDNVEMQIFLKDVFKNRYHLLLAENGKEGLKLAERNKPDLIISDLMMPIMDGIDMCKSLQKNKATQHIPVILLTAKNSFKSKLSGLESGAVAYIEKPFNFHELILKVNNIISTREKTISKYKTDLISSPKKIDAKSKDELFMEELVTELNNQLENTDFKLEDLPNTLNMSYSAIYRRCHDLTGKTLVEFFRSLRLNKAAILIKEQGYNISEAGYMVGYKDTKYFAKCFKEEFGESPGKLKRNAK
ncbi:ATP-binding protein [Cellulophaga sp. F20128]|uniref:hybrid sensor histidine kinase/response regulator transcription factor n=1 Tax=Cellulophaga sp. F20128 TaxID=2926413 RepID=UPI001FF48FF1|nr:ATP-binding protein [Cellulophaga sp. F20128]MCK0158030.1 ATP-binding protein [Cellulophaga sp. F20128]